MAIDERSRHELYLKLEAVLGGQEAATLMEHLPPVGWADIATKKDLDHLRALTKHDLDDFRAEVKHNLDGLRAEFTHNLDGLRAEFTHNLNELRYEFRADLADRLSAQTRTMMLAMSTQLVAVAGIAFAAARLI